MPPIGTPVWVEFEGGDPTYPIWTGCFWRVGDILPSDALPTVKFFKTKTVSIRMDDFKQEIEIKTKAFPNGIKVNPLGVTADGITVTSKAKGRQVAVTPVSVDVNNGGLTVV